MAACCVDPDCSDYFALVTATVDVVTDIFLVLLRAMVVAGLMIS